MPHTNHVLTAVFLSRSQTGSLDVLIRDSCGLGRVDLRSARELGFEVTSEEVVFTRWLQLSNRTVRFPAQGDRAVSAPICTDNIEISSLLAMRNLSCHSMTNCACVACMWHHGLELVRCCSSKTCRR